MDKDFDPKAQARLVAKLLKMSDSAIIKPGGAIVGQRLIDYAAEHLCALTSEQRLRVLDLMDKTSGKNLIKDGHGVVVGYAYSREIFVPLNAQPSSLPQQPGQFWPPHNHQAEKEVETPEVDDDNDAPDTVPTKRGRKGRKA